MNPNKIFKDTSNEIVEVEILDPNNNPYRNEKPKPTLTDPIIIGFRVISGIFGLMILWFAYYCLMFLFKTYSNNLG